MAQDDDGKIADLLAELWQKHLPTLRERLDLLDTSAIQASSGIIDEPHRLEALSVAHKLAGNLGMFGHHEGSRIASQIEHILKAPKPETLVSLVRLVTELRSCLAAVL